MRLITKVGNMRRIMRASWAGTDERFAGPSVTASHLKEKVGRIIFSSFLLR
jgi:hypothetical protein